MTYQVIARKYRPKKFNEVVGQEVVVKTILNALILKKVGHAYLFAGSRGTGKTTIARLFAKALNCKNPEKNAEPCNECSSCKEIALGQNLDVIEIDGASHRGIEDIRKISEMSLYAPQSGHFKIYLIDEVHMLTKEAFNALLKLLEEPPERVKFFFATTEIHKLPATILSRCQRFQLTRIPYEKIEEKLSSIALELGCTVEKEALNLLAKLSEGSLRDAEVLLDEVIVAFDRKISSDSVTTLFGLLPKERFFDLDEAVKKQDFATAISIANEIYHGGRNAEYFIEELTEHYRNILLSKKGVKTDPRYQTNVYSLENCLDIIELLVKASQEIKGVFSEKTYLQQVLIKIVRIVNKPSLEALVERLLALEGRLETKAPASSVVPLEKPAILEKLQSTLSSEKTSPTLDKLKPAVENKVAPTLEKSPSISSEKAAPEMTLEKSKPEASSASLEKADVLTIKEKSRYDTMMRFAAKELGGSLKKE